MTDDSNAFSIRRSHSDYPSCSLGDVSQSYGEESAEAISSLQSFHNHEPFRDLKTPNRGHLAEMPRTCARNACHA